MANGSIQAPGRECPDHWHCCYPDKLRHSCPLADFAPVDSTCPTCGAVMMPGGAVTPEFYAEYNRRLAAGICLRSRAGTFLCKSKVKPAVLASGTCLCGRHNR